MTLTTPPPTRLERRVTPRLIPPKAGLYSRLGAWCAKWRWLVVAVWLLVLAGTTFGSTALNGSYNATLSLPNSSAQIGADLIKAHSNQANAAAPGTATGEVVFHVTNGSLADQKAAIDASVATIGRLNTVRAVGDPFSSISPNGKVAVASITYKDTVTILSSSDVAAVDAAVAPVRHSGIAVDYGGDLGKTASGGGTTNTSAEVIGVGVALVILLLTFGSVLAMLLPVISALVGVFAGLGVLGVLSAYFQFPSESPTLALMMGLGVGIDYALFLSTRYRQHILDGDEPQTAVSRAIASSGRAVVIAASTVVISLIGLYVSGISYIGQLGLSAGITVAVAALAAITLVPALLAIAGRRIDVLKIRRTPIAEPSRGRQGWNRYATVLSRRPLLYLVAAITVLLVLAAPLLTIQVGDPGVRALPAQSTERLASEAIDAGFGPGYQSQLVVVAKIPANQSDAQVQSVAASLEQAVSSTNGVASTTKFAATPDRAVLVGKVTPTTGGGDPQTTALVGRLQNTVLPQQLSQLGYTAYVTGKPAVQMALQNAVAAALPVIILAVVGAAMLLILLTFRSPILALKAGLINLLSIGASYGVLIAVFQWGWGSALLGVPQPVPIVSFVPILMFAIVFGLSMDYEVFLLSRVREAWMLSQDNKESVTHGLSITAAAVIMACVFFSFLLTPSATIKMLALGLGVSVLIDVTLVRLVIVPSAMFLFGRLNWWTPRWLGAMLHRLEL